MNRLLYTIHFLSIYVFKTKSLYIGYLYYICVKESNCRRKHIATMAVVVCLILHLIISTVSGLDFDVWKKEIEKRLLSLEELNVHFQEENANLRSLISETQRENKILKRELNDLVERVSKCEEVILNEDEDTHKPEETATKTRESDDGLRIYSTENGQPGQRIGE